MAGGTRAYRGVRNIVLHRRTLFSQVDLGLFLGFQIDRGAVVGSRDRPGQERTVVTRIVPGETARIAAIIPEWNCELDRLDRLLAVECHGFAVRFDLLPPPRP